jgi:hypothetical protein
MKGIISTVIGGFGEGLGKFGEHLGRLNLQDEAGKIASAREERLSELRERAEIRGEERKRTQAAAIGTEAESARAGTVDDLSGTMRARTALEGSEAEAGVYRKHGLIDSAMRVQDSERSRQDRAEARLDARTDRNADNVRADKQFEATTAHQKRQDDIAMQNAVRLKELTNAQIEHLKGGKVPLPNIKVETLEYDGLKRIVNVDQNSGAIGVVTPGARAEPGESNWFSPDKPAKPEEQPTVTWSLNGRVLPGGLADLYPAMKARIGDQGQPGAAPGTSPPQAAIEHLRKNPHLAGSFEEHYKLPKGAAERVLNGTAKTEAEARSMVAKAKAGDNAAIVDPFRPRPPVEADIPGGEELDAAKERLASAHRRIQSFGALQRRTNPSGFEAAQKGLDDAEQAVNQAKAIYDKAFTGGGAARFRPLGLIDGARSP